MTFIQLQIACLFKGLLLDFQLYFFLCPANPQTLISTEGENLVIFFFSELYVPYVEHRNKTYFYHYVFFFPGMLRSQFSHLLLKKKTLDIELHFLYCPLRVELSIEQLQASCSKQQSSTVVTYCATSFLLGVALQQLI